MSLALIRQMLAALQGVVAVADRKTVEFDAAHAAIAAAIASTPPDAHRRRTPMSKPTPGPWLVATSNSWRRIVSVDGQSVCEPVVYSVRDPHPDLYFRNGGENGPDARLIAAAPELLEALQAAEKVLTGDELGQVRAAIAKATREPS